MHFGSLWASFGKHFHDFGLSTIPPMQEHFLFEGYLSCLGLERNLASGSLHKQN
jgi:hypothetical protein